MGLGTVSQNWRRGRPGVRPSESRGRRRKLPLDFGSGLGSAVAANARITEEVKTAFQLGASSYNRDFEPYAPLALKILQEKRFPRLRRAQVNFLADSMAGLGRVSPRRSRDICYEEREKEKLHSHILRYSMLSVPAAIKANRGDHACPKCGTKIDFGLGSIFGPNLM